MTTVEQDLKKKYGDGTMISFEENTVYGEFDVISTGSLLLDDALGIGGIPCGRLTELYGPQGAGKSTLACHVLANAQKMFPEKKAVYIDAEHVFDLNRAKVLGVSTHNFLLNQPSSGEEAFDVIESFIRGSETSVIILDSVAAVVPMAEIKSEMDEATVGVLARLVTKALRKIGPNLPASKTALLFTNQVRDNIGYGGGETIPGGRALGHAASIIIKVARVAWIHQGQEVVGLTTKADVVKNKCAPPKRQAEFTIKFDRGVSSSGELLQVAENLGIIHRAGPYYKKDDIVLGLGRDAAERYFDGHPELVQEVIDGLRHRS